MNEATVTPQAGKNPPLHRIAGKGGVFLKIWEKTSPENGPFVSTELGRTYKDDQGQWRVSRNLTVDQLNQLPGMIAEAGMHIRQWEREQREARRTHRRAQQPDQGLEAEHQKVLQHAVEPAPAQAAPQQIRGPDL